ncbi:MAG: IucA/IucC family protein [Streptosporangiales bacterium]|nr:IucA/IucC family protein [Streptosporangiales bacterium]
MDAPPASAPSGGEAAGSEVAGRRLLDALLREGYGGLRQRVVYGPTGPRLYLPGRAAPVSLEPDGFLAELRVRPGCGPALEEVLAAAAEVAAVEDDVTALARECRESLRADVLYLAHRPAVLGRLAAADPYGPGTYHEALAAGVDHPVYPAARCRLGLTEEQLLAYAPEFRPSFALRWVAVPGAAVRRTGDRPRWWPRPAAVGLTEASGDELLPVHPLMLDGPLREASVAGIRVGPEPYLCVTPTLSMRTVAVTTDPSVHLKLPLPVSTLGLRNVRSLVPGTLADGALVADLLERVSAAEGGTVLIADESRYAHAGHAYLGYLLRCFPSGLDRDLVLPVAALTAPAPSGRPLITELAAEAADGDPVALFGRYLRALFEWNVTLLVKYGIALEAHQQNLMLALGPYGLRLLVKDNDGAMLHLPRLYAALRGRAPGAAAFADQRLLTTDDHDLVNVFVTITLHLCAAAPAIALAEAGVADRGTLLALVRDRLAEALDRYTGEPAAELMRRLVLDADRLPGKSMVTAGTLVDKSRTRARDINKYYGTSGPNYLRGLPGAGNGPDAGDDIGQEENTWNRARPTP